MSHPIFPSLVIVVGVVAVMVEVVVAVVVAGVIVGKTRYLGNSVQTPLWVAKKICFSIKFKHFNDFSAPPG